MAKEKEKAKAKKPEKGGEVVPVRPVLGISPFSQMERMFFAPFREMERMFDDLMPRRLFAPEELVSAPAVDIFEEGDDIVVKAELPGMKKEELDVNITDNMIIISGEKKKEEKVERKDYYRVERSVGHFSRSLPLPADVQVGKARAGFKDGVLEVRIPKTEEARKKKQKILIE
jgi:HSP20 family protein